MVELKTHAAACFKTTCKSQSKTYWQNKYNLVWFEFLIKTIYLTDCNKLERF